ncbi:YitT family protein [Bariatricus massiliensis]|uniref:YitT family protein n=1 Tax=Bariatricus massiliensis TaxID=1745713 RepID=A0ABS8DIA6_9FIRM|nr:YitT family protein [Bariatricus massiliensis]MCB7304601.1 YitT family protein [Bariatricus massiliensis]MCB7374752.1 YitT family protein [Bariatricus massiliensis]MCB7388121.1 YitT family protein [Bariatricus massiliensis]MCB7411917.1 YitT family protein [Bariatricus massiliensis]MCQ5254292.1 YitT family protein [Bariatricus massiliensis]
MSFTSQQKQNLAGLGTSALGAVLFAFGLNVFIIPLSLYNGGFMGIAQLLRTFLVQVFNLSLGHTDIAGFIYLLINVPLIILAWSKMGKNFFFRSVVTIVIQTIAMTALPVPEVPIIDDYLTACVIGGIIAGGGSGLTLRGGSSGGGQDILGIYMTQRFPGFSVGKVSLIINIFVYGICLFMFNIEVAIYSLIYGVIYSLACDKVHVQNINVSIMIFTKKLGISRAILEQTGRGVTNWDGAGAYTNATSYILLCVVSKYEVNQIKRIVKTIDPNAFMILTEGCSVAGNFEKRLT